MRNTRTLLPRPRERAVLRSVSNALALLEAFSLERPELGVTELSRTLGLGKSTVHRLLAALGARGYVRQNPQTARYCLGLKAFEVGALAAGQRSVRETVAPFLQRLRAASRETVHLGVLDEGEVIYIDKIESHQALQMYSQIGRRAPLHCTALGKALLAWEPDAERFLRRRLRAYTPSTITDSGTLREDLERVRAAGYALDDEEFEAGLKCVAAPLRDHTGRVVASLGVASPAVRLPAARMAALAGLVGETAAAASRALGFPGRRP
ncbi:MAG: IclR family transcriptional regulator [Candidatus Rokubacteria bacterium]|nr:IclR family transcriptional regulator [Candidatus Rokubacteria bacterium]